MKEIQSGILSFIEGKQSINNINGTDVYSVIKMLVEGQAEFLFKIVKQMKEDI